MQRGDSLPHEPRLRLQEDQLRTAAARIVLQSESRACAACSRCRFPASGKRLPLGDCPGFLCRIRFTTRERYAPALESGRAAIGYKEGMYRRMQPPLRRPVARSEQKKAPRPCACAHGRGAENAKSLQARQASCSSGTLLCWAWATASSSVEKIRVTSRMMMKWLSFLAMPLM